MFWNIFFVFFCNIENLIFLCLDAEIDDILNFNFNEMEEEEKDAEEKSEKIKIKNSKQS